MLSNFKNSFQTSSNNNSKFEPTHTYVDINVFNNNSDSMVPQPLIFNQTKNQNIINDCSDFHASVIRWQADSMLPVLIPDMELTKIYGLYRLWTKYYVTMGYSATGLNNIVMVPNDDNPLGGQPIWFKPQITNSTLYPNYKAYADGDALFPLSQQEVLNNPFFWITSIQWFLDMINEAYYKLWEVLYIQHGPNSGANKLFEAFIAPNFRWNSATNNIDLVAGGYYTDFTSNAPTQNQIYLGMNAPLYNLLSSFNATISYKDPTSYLLSNYRLGLPYFLNLVFSDDLPTSLTYDINGTSLYRVYEWSSENSPITSWTPVSSIVFSSYTIPVNSTESGSVYFLGQSNNNTTSNNAISNTITDFEIQQSKGTELANSVLYYVPVAEYRLLDLNSNNPLSQLNIKVSWKDKFGQYHDYLLKYGGNASLKLLFRKKNFESSNIY